jgi:hypothetical protein
LIFSFLIKSIEDVLFYEEKIILILVLLHFDHVETSFLKHFISDGEQHSHPFGEHLV